jgi:hypothetical protein
MIWVLAGSYYIRSGTPDYDQTWERFVRIGLPNLTHRFLGLLNMIGALEDLFCHSEQHLAYG